MRLLQNPKDGGQSLARRIAGEVLQEPPMIFRSPALPNSALICLAGVPSGLCQERLACVTKDDIFGATSVSAVNCGRDGARPSGEKKNQAEMEGDLLRRTRDPLLRLS